jgi:hypothetical protein
METGMGRVHPLLRSKRQQPLLDPVPRPLLRRPRITHQQGFVLRSAVYVVDL